MANIGLVAVDSHHYPNLPLGKIAAYHKSIGDTVEWANPMFGNYDKVFMSKIFTFTPDCMDIYGCPVERGGSGYDLHKDLPSEIDRLQPDYSLFPFVDDKTAYGFLTRGCPNKCSFCVVLRKEGGIRPYMDIDEITQGGRRPKVHLMDNNSLACDYGIEQLVKIIDKGYRVDYNQAIDSRLITPEVAELLAQAHWLEPIKFGCDSPKQIETSERAMSLIDGCCEKIGRKPRNYLLFTIIMGDINECYERISHFRQYPRVRVHAQPMREFNNPRQTIPQWQKDMARWADRKELYRTCDFKEFQPRKNFFCREYFVD